MKFEGSGENIKKEEELQKATPEFIEKIRKEANFEKPGETGEMSAKDLAAALDYVQESLDFRVAKKDRPEERRDIILESDAADELKYFTRFGGKTVNINQIESELNEKLSLYKQAEGLPIEKARKLLGEISSSESEDEVYKRMRRIIRQTNRALEILGDIKS